MSDTPVPASQNSVKPDNQSGQSQAPITADTHNIVSVPNVGTIAVPKSVDSDSLSDIAHHVYAQGSDAVNGAFQEVKDTGKGIASVFSRPDESSPADERHVAILGPISLASYRLGKQALAQLAAAHTAGMLSAKQGEGYPGQALAIGEHLPLAGDIVKMLERGQVGSAIGHGLTRALLTKGAADISSGAVSRLANPELETAAGTSVPKDTIPAPRPPMGESPLELEDRLAGTYKPVAKPVAKPTAESTPTTAKPAATPVATPVAKPVAKLSMDDQLTQAFDRTYREPVEPAVTAVKPRAVKVPPRSVANIAPLSESDRLAAALIRKIRGETPNVEEIKPAEQSTHYATDQELLDWLTKQYPDETHGVLGSHAAEEAGPHITNIFGKTYDPGDTTLPSAREAEDVRDAAAAYLKQLESSQPISQHTAAASAGRRFADWRDITQPHPPVVPKPEPPVPEDLRSPLSHQSKPSK